MIVTADAARRDGLRRARALAVGLLALMALIYVGGSLAPRDWAPGPWAAAFGEAGMVGAIADWFAVTALFRRPLGLPIPHTAIVPRNKDRIAQALGDFIANSFLEPRILDRKVIGARPAERLARLLNDPDVVRAVSRRIAAWAPGALSAGPAMADLIAAVVRRIAQAGPLAPTAGRVLDRVWRDKATASLVDRAVVSLAAFLDQRPELVQTAVEARTWSWAPRWLDRTLAERLARAVQDTLEEMRDAAHPVRQALDAQVERLIARLIGDPDYLARGEALKGRMLADPGLLAAVTTICSDAARRLAADPRAVRDLIEAAVARALLATGEWLAGDAAARDRLDMWIRVGLRRLLTPGRKAIGEFVAQVVSGWDAGEVADRLELQVGRDLQFIRINGAIVGALVGLVIYAVSHLAS